MAETDKGPSQETISAMLDNRPFCERGDCRTERVSDIGPKMQFTCSTCLTLWDVWLTGLGPAWQRVATISACVETPQ